MKKKPHRHAALIHAYADGAEIQIRLHSQLEEWADIPQPDWSGDEYRIKPAKVYPASTLDYNELCDVVNLAHKLPGNEGYQTKIARLAADAAVAEFIESGEMTKYVEEHGAS